VDTKRFVFDSKWYYANEIKYTIVIDSKTGKTYLIVKGLYSTSGLAIQELSEDDGQRSNK